MDGLKSNPYSIGYQFGTNPTPPSNPTPPPWTNKFLQGVFYAEFLKQIHNVCKPSSYFEIGVETGATLALAQCRSVAVDPVFKFRVDPIGKREESYFFQLTSDDFFARHNLKSFLPGGPDVAFLDGMHHYEFLLRDIMNTEKSSHRATVALLHDCYPINPEMADREQFGRRIDQATQRWWTGDVWKLLPILRDYRPDIKVTILDCPPTGLVVAQGLDANSNVLANAYDEIIAKYKDIDLHKFGLDRFQDEFTTVNSHSVFQPDSLKTFLALQA